MASEIAAKQVHRGGAEEAGQKVITRVPAPIGSEVRLQSLSFGLGGVAVTLPEFKQICEEAKKEIKEIDLDELKRMQGAHLVDVREKEEQEKGMIPGAVGMPRGVLELHIDEVTTDKDKPIVLYCGGGSRSALAAQSLKKMGFRNVMSLIGGYRGWKESQGK
jgi:rhodanese-related sulfurtransferase